MANKDRSEPDEVIVDLSKLERPPFDKAKYWQAASEAAVICLESQGHAPGIILPITGMAAPMPRLTWQPSQPGAPRAWRDLSEATEWGAAGIAVLLAFALASFRAVERSPKGTGYDYFLTNNVDDLPFQGATRLEVSGILRAANAGPVRARAEQKAQRLRRYQRDLPAMVIVIEFNKPHGYVLDIP